VRDLRADIPIYEGMYQNYKVLTREEERTLIERVQRDQCQDALEKLIFGNIRWIVKYCDKMDRDGRYRHVPVEDKIQLAIVGLIKATKKFDLTKTTRFLTYAGYWVLQAIQDANVAYMNFRDVEYHTARISTKKDGAQRATDLQAAIGYTTNGKSKNPMTLETIFGVDKRKGPVQETDDEDENNTRIKQVYQWVENDLSETEKTIVKHRFGIGTTEKRFDEIAPIVGMKRISTQRACFRAVKKMRKLAEAA
jgi:RNA polymerase sigma factor (sigma-70 family)